MKLYPSVLLLLALSGCYSRVVDDFTRAEQCRDFFANPDGTLSPPTVFTEDNYKQICQIRDNTHEYATLYDTANRIPVYSAYKFEGLMNCTRQTSWYIEPQLEDGNNDAEMALESSVANIQHQAVNKDYEKSRYDKGHLAPVYHARTQSCSDATFTLTNAAPQNLSFNRGQWKVTEKAVADALKKCKENFKYIVTGVVPGSRTLNNRVRIPSHFWTAYCCLDNNLRVKASGAFLGQNLNIPVPEMSVSVLDSILTDVYGKGTFRVFGGRCDHPTSADLKRLSQIQHCQSMVLTVSKKRCVKRVLGRMIRKRIFLFNSRYATCTAHTGKR